SFRFTTAASPTARLTPVWRAVLKPADSALTSYLPTGSDNTRYVPASSVRNVRPAPVSLLVTVMVAPGTAAPVESSTLPETDAVTCARTVPVAKQMQKKTLAKACANTLPSERILHLPFSCRNFGGIIRPLGFA